MRPAPSVRKGTIDGGSEARCLCLWRRDQSTRGAARIVDGVSRCDAVSRDVSAITSLTPWHEDMQSKLANDTEEI